MVSAVIAGEDGKFCTHNGFDTEAIEQAAQRNAQGKKMRGGSTISQQTAKNVFLWQGSGWDRWARKGLEVWFTFLIETLWDKRRIMEVYLNVAETGIGTYGVEAGRSAISTSPPRAFHAAKRRAWPPPCPAPRSAVSTTRAASPGVMATPSRPASAWSAATGWMPASTSRAHAKGEEAGSPLPFDAPCRDQNSKRTPTLIW
jgi:hypothetical protein